VSFGDTGKDPHPTSVWCEIFHFPNYNIFLGYKQLKRGNKVFWKGQKMSRDTLADPLHHVFLEILSRPPFPSECHVLFEWLLKFVPFFQQAMNLGTGALAKVDASLKLYPPSSVMMKHTVPQGINHKVFDICFLCLNLDNLWLDSLHKATLTVVSLYVFDIFLWFFS